MSRSAQLESLVKYETAILVSSSFQGKSSQKKKPTPQPDLIPTADSDKQQRTEDYLNKILPPQESVEDNQLWVRYVSPTPATSADVSNLTRELQKRLTHQEARDCGICPIREELFSQCFDELIRQITINCAERGYLLLRVRDEFRMMKSTLQGLYDSSIAYGMKKALVDQQTRQTRKDYQISLEKEIKANQRQIEEMEEEIETKTIEHDRSRVQKKRGALGNVPAL